MASKRQLLHARQIIDKVETRNVGFVVVAGQQQVGRVGLRAQCVGERAPRPVRHLGGVERHAVAQLVQLDVLLDEFCERYTIAVLARCGVRAVGWSLAVSVRERVREKTKRRQSTRSKSHSSAVRRHRAASLAAHAQQASSLDASSSMILSSPDSLIIMIDRVCALPKNKNENEGAANKRVWSAVFRGEKTSHNTSPHRIPVGS